MAKDPAFLFYPSDFLTGCQDLTMEERGQFITLLCLEHQKGRLTEKMIRLSCGNATADVMAKFRQDSAGFWYNERLEKEMEKRAAHSQKQRERASNGWKTRKGECHGNAMAMPLENRDINRIENTIEIKKESDENFKNETGQETGMDNVRPIESIRHRHWPANSKECEDYFASKGSTSAAGASFFRKYEAQAWMISGNAIVKWKFKADEWISNPNKFGSTEPKKVLEITASDYDSIPQTSYGTI
jgi:uncharacterized protein YdaU (DUF1376 family)